jgi:hypothetical protein
LLDFDFFLALIAPLPAFFFLVFFFPVEEEPGVVVTVVDSTAAAPPFGELKHLGNNLSTSITLLESVIDPDSA